MISVSKSHTQKGLHGWAVPRQTFPHVHHIFFQTIIQGSEQVLGATPGHSLKVKETCTFSTLSNFSQQPPEGQWRTKAFSVPLILLVLLRDSWLRILGFARPALLEKDLIIRDEEGERRRERKGRVWRPEGEWKGRCRAEIGFPASTTTSILKITS